LGLWRYSPVLFNLELEYGVFFGSFTHTCPSLRKYFLAYWSIGSHKLKILATENIDPNHNSKHILNNIINYLNTKTPNTTQQKQLTNILFTADTYIDNHIIKFNIKFNTFRTEITSLSASWITLLIQCIKSKNYIPYTHLTAHKYLRK